MLEIKICGLCRPADASLAAEAGATHAGVIRVPGTPRWRPVGVAREILDAAAGLRRVAVFANAAPDDIEREAEILGADVVQLHGEESAETAEALAAGGLEVWKVVKPADGQALVDAAARYAAVDLLLVEGSSARGLGGVGAAFDWALVASARERLHRRVRLGAAGGLTPENVADAVARLRPALVDVSSGVEGRVGEKDATRVREFVACARAAEAAHTATGER